MLLNFSGHHPHPFALYLVVLIRNLCSDLLPARIGSMIYIFLLSTRLKVPLDQATSSFSLALLFDICSIAPMVLVAMLFLEESANLSPLIIILAALALLLFSALLIYFLPYFFHFAAIICGKISFLSKTTRDYLSKLLEDVNQDIIQVQKAGLYTRIFILSILIRVFKYAGLYFILYALLQPRGYSYSELPWANVFFGLVVPEFAASLPISGIAGFGAYQGAWVFMFQLLGFPQEIAQITSLSHHIISQAYGFLIGIAATLILFIPLRWKVTDANYAKKVQLSGIGVFLVKLICFLISLFVIAYLIENKTFL